jgi:uncharacterized protein (TIGR02231 family)
LIAQTKYLDQMQSFNGAALMADIKAGALNFEQLSQLAVFNFSQRDRIAAKRTALRAVNHQTSKAMSELSKAMAKFDEEAAQPAHEPHILLDKSSQGVGEVRLSYRVHGVSWQPTYRVDAHSDKAKVTLRLDAQIQQGSGEDWPSAALSIFSNPAPIRLRGSDIQTLPVELSKAKPVSQGKNQHTYASANEVQIAQLTLPKQDAMAVAAGGKQRGTSWFRPQRPPALHNTSQHQYVRLATYHLDASHRHSATPLLGPEVYREVEVVNGSSTNLPAGRAALYVDGQLTGEADFGTATTGARFVVGLGVDPRVTVERNLIDRETRVEGNERIVSASLAVRVANHTGQAISLRLRDRLPQPGKRTGMAITDFAASQPLSTESAYRETGHARGILQWDLEVPANTAAEQWQLEYSYGLRFDRNFHMVLAR